MYPDSSELNDPKTPADIFLLEGCYQLFGEVGQGIDQHFPGRTQYHDTGCRFRRETQDVAEVEIERDEASLFPSTNVIYRFVGYAVKFLIMDGQNIVTRLAQNPGNTQPEILVELEFHADFSMGSGT